MKSPAIHARQRGFTLVEVLVALAIGVFILTSLAVLFANNSSNQGELERTTRQVESARFALDVLAEDIQHGGYFGEFSPDSMVVAASYSTPVACTAAVADLGWSLPAPPAAPQLPSPVQGIAAATTAACLGSRRANTEALMVRHADTGTPVTPATVTAGNLYVQTSRCSTGSQLALAGSASGDFTLQLPDCATINSEVRRVVQRTYFVADCNDCSVSDGIPTLKRAEWIDGSLRISSMAEGIENLQFEFGLDTDANGQPDSFVAVGGVTGVAPATWENVVAVRVHMLARNTQSTATYTDARTYVLGAVTVAPADGFKRTLLTSTVRVNNVGGRREK